MVLDQATEGGEAVPVGEPVSRTGIDSTDNKKFCLMQHQGKIAQHPTALRLDKLADVVI
jgi:hypothetical protein